MRAFVRPADDCVASQAMAEQCSAAAFSTWQGGDAFRGFALFVSNSAILKTNLPAVRHFKIKVRGRGMLLLRHEPLAEKAEWFLRPLQRMSLWHACMHCPFRSFLI